MNLRKVRFLAGSLALLYGHSTLLAQGGRAGTSPPASRGGGTSAAHANRSANTAFGLLRIGARPDSAEWMKTLAEQGLVPWDGHDDVWHLVASDGEVRVLSIFAHGGTATIFRLMFFPPLRTPLSDATLSWMYRTATSYSFEDGNGVELEFPSAAGLWGGSVSQTLLVDLASSAMIRNSVSIIWKPKP
jgi:hypothetical protein